MASVKIILWKHDQKKDGTFPLAIRITQNRKIRYVFTGKYILENQWKKTLSKVKKSHPNSVRLNNYLLKKLREADSIALDADVSKENITSKDIKNKVQRKCKSVSFFQFGAQRVKQKFQSGTYSVTKPELSILLNIREFLNCNKFEERHIIIDRIKQSRKARIGKSRKAGYSFLNEVKKEFEKDTSLYFEDINEAFFKQL